MAPPNTTTVEPETTTDPPMRMDAEMFMSCGYCIKWKKGRVKKVTVSELKQIDTLSSKILSANASVWNKTILKLT